MSDIYKIVDNAYAEKCKEQGLNQIDWHNGELFSYWDVIRLLKEFAFVSEEGVDGNQR